jgi:hypothetical protein
VAWGEGEGAVFFQNNIETEMRRRERRGEGGQRATLERKPSEE